MAYCKKRDYPVYTFIIEKVNGSNIVAQIEASSKSDALDYFFDLYSIRLSTISSCKGFYFDKKGELREMDLASALRRRVS